MVSQKIKSFAIQCVRVWRVLRKPSSEEFKSMAKISAIGILLLGLVGFTFSILIKSFL